MATVINPLTTIRAPAPVTPGTPTEPEAEAPVFQTLKISQNNEKAVKDRDIKAKQAAQRQRNTIKNMGNINERYAAYGNPVTRRGQAKKGATKSIEEYRNTKKYETTKLKHKLL
jgi:negative regulator of sigma E activity